MPNAQSQPNAAATAVPSPFDPATASSADIRQALVEAVRLDLVGPDNDHPFARELLPESPRRWYLTGYLVPTRLPDREADQGEDDDIDSPTETEGADDGDAVDRRPAKKGLLPSSMGLSVLVPPGVDCLAVTAEWGDYDFEPAEGDDAAAEGAEPAAEPGVGNGDPLPHRRGGFRREPRSSAATVSLSEATGQPARVDLPGSDGLELVVTARPVTTAGPRLPAGTRSVAVFLVNNRTPDPERAYVRFAFQPRLTVACSEPFVPRPDLRGSGEPTGDEGRDDADERIADVQFRDAVDFAVGHGVSVTWSRDEQGRCREVCTEWIPDAEVERVEPRALSGVELGMEALGNLPDDAAAVRAALSGLVSQYRDWITVQERVLPALDGSRRDTAEGMIASMKTAARRIENGIELIATDAQALDAFRIANRAMAAAARRRQWITRGREGTPASMDVPTWRPFQLAFFLLSLTGITDETHADRERVDLLFFPTGGGKTEAYLGLAAYTMVLRRLRHGVPGGCGLSVLMRYTLRLLTLDQLGRATALMCALELERLQAREKLGDWPFEIGLWVGMAATPNRMGRRGDDEPGKDSTAYTRTMQYRQQPNRHSAPIPIEECPWCGKRFEPDSFRLMPNVAAPLDLHVHCVDHGCEFSGDRHLPIVAVDEPIYRRLPAFLIATVDKFAALPWTGRTGTLFGHVDRHDGDGFYGPCDPGRGASLPSGLLPGPDLIIQDELHLISGPLGTIAGVYEAAIDALASRSRGDQPIRPKIIASTATVRRATAQIKALFERMETQVFPPPGPDRRDSFFAITVPPNASPARLYLGVAAQGRSQKVVFLRTMLAVAAAAQQLWVAAGGKRNKANPVDPYMTALGYFNSLRELGGSRRIVEDEVLSRLEHYASRKRREPQDTLFASRSMHRIIPELTSRVSTGDVAATKARLQKPFTDDDRVDVALATNMISVGLDIVRLGLMLVVGQPKTSAEYIQATSRVGRDPRRPGLVITIFNIHKPRDRSHYERFGSYHASFYRAVEATSVTPFSPRALDRALVGTLVALVRHSDPRLTPPRGAEEVAALRPQLTAIAHRLAERARDHAWPRTPGAAQELHDLVLNRCISLLDEWVRIIAEFRNTGTRLEYQAEVRGGARLLYGFLDPELKDIPVRRRQFRANRSMRDVEPSVSLYLRKLIS